MLDDSLIQADITLVISRCEEVSDSLLNSYEALLSDGERQRNQRYRFATDRRKDLIARALLRTQLGERLQMAPESLVFERGEHGKPALVLDNSLEFNLSHAGDWIVLAMAESRIGVDIEHTARDNDVIAIADRYFFGSEISLGLSKFGFSVANKPDITIEMDGCLNDSPSDWQFFCVTPNADYRLAVAFNSSKKPTVACYDCIPLESHTSVENILL
ncbi:MAG: hypothetical protein QMB64_05090 [Pseudomonadales bacterium]